MTEYSTVRISRDAWKRINQEREPNETMDEVICRMFDDRRKLRIMLKSSGQAE